MTTHKDLVEALREAKQAQATLSKINPILEELETEKQPIDRSYYNTPGFKERLRDSARQAMADEGYKQEIKEWHEIVVKPLIEGK